MRDAGTDPPPAPWSEQDGRVWLVAGALLFVGALLRLTLLARAGFQHDEAIHGVFAFNLCHRGEYHFDPPYHGPLLYYLVALVFRLFGDSSVTARLVPAACGVGLLALVLGPARRWLGTRAVLFSVGLLAISPSLVTYSRRLLHDSLVLVLTLGAVLCFAVTLEASARRTRRAAWLGLIALLTLFLTTKISVIFVVAMLLGFQVAVWLRAAGGRWSRPLPAWTPAAAFAAVILAAIAASLRVLAAARHELMLFAASAAAALCLWEWLRRAPADARPPPAPPGVPRRRLDWVTPLGAALIAAFLFAFLYGHGEAWFRDPARRLPQSWPDIKHAMPLLVGYWSAQQKTPRIPGPHDYYLVLLALYELPIVIAAAGGVIHAARRRTLFGDLLLWWAFTALAAYSLANEMVPWLVVHLVVPFALLGGTWLAALSSSPRVSRAALVAACVAGAVFLLRGVSATNFERAVDWREPLFFAWVGDSYREVLLRALRESQQRPGVVAVQESWPAAWYVRRVRGVTFGRPAAGAEVRLAVLRPADWRRDRDTRYAGWHSWSWDPARGAVLDQGQPPTLLAWPRASWRALLPHRWARFWLLRDNAARPGFLREWSSARVVIATPP